MKFICEYCDKEFDNAYSLAGHKGNCKLNPKRTHRSGKNNPMYGKIPYNKIPDTALYKARDGNNLDVTRGYIKEYKKSHICCEICGRKLNNLCVDHDHKTNKFRGLLCSSCNRALGWYEHDMEGVKKYLARGNA